MDFRNRAIELTSEKIKLEFKYKELKNAVDNTSFSDRSRTRLCKRLIKMKQSIEHCENNLKLNRILIRGE